MKPLIPVIVVRCIFVIWIVLFWVEVAYQVAIWKGCYKP